MAKPPKKEFKKIAARLVATRKALGFDSPREQLAFCKQIRVGKTTYNPFEKGGRRITVDVAIKIRKRFTIPLDWIYCGDPALLPSHVYLKYLKLKRSRLKAKTAKATTAAKAKKAKG